MTLPQPLIETGQLAARLAHPHLVLLDASWHMPADARDAGREFAACHIPGARFFDIDEISDAASPYPHMVPSPETFAAAVGHLGIGPESEIVAYDTRGLFSAARAWWMFRLFGHRRVSVLHGGLPKWRGEGRPLSDTPVAASAKDFIPHISPSFLATLDQVRAASLSGSAILDARSAERFEGNAPEPRAGLRAGHIPASRNLPWGDLLEPPYQTFRSDEALKRCFADAGIDRAKPVIATCGSGISACILALGLAILGNDLVAVYDGSWAEWGGRDDLPNVTGKA